jgi:DNA primase catalytic core
VSISQTSIDQIKQAVHIADIIGEFVAFSKKGINFIACCPFHNERAASFIVNPSRNRYKCFGCGKSGDAFEFLKEHEAMSYPQALRYVARKYNIQIEEDEKSVEQSDADFRRESIFAALNWAQSHFSDNLSKDKGAIDYLKKRDLVKAVKDFCIGYAASGNDLLRAAASAGYSTKVLLDAGLVKVNDQDGHFYDAFSKRLIFPFHDRSGRIIGFTGRLLIAQEGKPKYLNTSETEVFRKSRFLYGLFQSKRFIIQENECILVEGQTDMISMYLGGIKNVVAGSGTALSEEQVKMIRTLASKLTLIYDFDPAGIKAAVKNIVLPLQLGLDVYVVVLPDKEDPDSFIRRTTGEEMKNYIRENRKDIVSFRIELIKEEIEKDPLRKAYLLKELTAQFSVIPDEYTRNILISEISRKLDYNLEDLFRQVKKLLPKAATDKEKGFYGLDVAAEIIKEKDLAIILADFTQVVGRHANGDENTISLPDGILLPSELTRLAGLTKNVVIEGIENITDEDDNELPLPGIGRLLTEMGVHVEICTKDPEGVKNNSDFLDSYVLRLSKYLYSHPDTKRSKRFVELVAEFLSKLDNTIIHIKTNEIAKLFGLTQASFTKVLKPYIDKRKSLAVQAQEKVVIDDMQYVFDIAHLPDYVDTEFFQRYGFFPAQNKTGHKIFYVFRTLENTLAKIGNFYLEPLFQVHDLDPNKNKRIAMLYHAELNKEEFVEFKSSEMVELAQFKKFLWNVGGYLFTGGKQFHHEKILESNALKYPKCHELSTFGHQPEGFFAYANGIISDGAFTSVDELGLVRYKNETFYSPSFSKIYKDQRSDNDRYEYDRFLVYRADQRTSWVQWSTLMNDVYRYNNNGMWALLFAILSSNRSIIFPIDRLFTSLFFIGPTESGKSKIAESIRAPWMYGAPLFNLNSGTDAAFFTALERFRDIVVILEEYNDYQITDVKFQGLKAAVYDNEGKQKRKDATSKDIDVSKVNGSPIILGQEGPERDDGALGNRVVQLHVPKKDNWTDDEVNRYKDLKDRERDGLSNIALEIIKRRGVVQQHFAGYMRLYQKKVKQDIQNEGGTYQTRIINTVSLFIAMAKLWEDHVKDLPLPFSFEEFYVTAKRQIVRQSEELSSSNRLSAFFDSISMLYAQGHIISGREFDIVSETRVTVSKSRNETEEFHWNGESRKVLYLIVNDVIQVYQKMHNQESLKLNALRMYLKDHPSYIGQVKSHRFNYQYEAWEADTVNDVSRRVIHKAERNTSCIALDYTIISLMGIDLERIKTDKEIEYPVIETDKKPDLRVKQTGLEFSDQIFTGTDDDGLPF